MNRFFETCERIAATTRKLEKTSLVAEYLKSRSLDEAAVSTIFFSGRPFPVWEETTLQVGGSMLWRIVAELAGKSGNDLSASYRKLGDLGAVAAEVLPKPKTSVTLNVLEVENSLRAIAAARGPSAKGAAVRDLLARAEPLEAKYIVKIMTAWSRRPSLKPMARLWRKCNAPTCCSATLARPCGWQ